MNRRLVVFLFLFIGSFQHAFTQVVINEGCNRNYISATDEDGDKPDWIELYNAGNSLVDLTGYYLSDNLLQPLQWPLAGLSLAPNEFKLIYCSGKDRYESSPFSPAVNDLSYSPFVGWNTHNFTNTFNWDGQSNIILNICSYENNGYTENSIFKQTETPYNSTIASWNDGSDASCSSVNGGIFNRRPNLKINGITLDFGTLQNSNTDYPAPYGNWYWSARHQILVHGAELIAAGLTAGPINSIGFEVVSTNTITYTYIDVSISATLLNDLSTNFIPLNGFGNHSNFKIESNGESVFLSDPSLTTISSLYINSPQTDVSIGRSPDASTNNQWMEPSPESSNNASIVYTDSLKAPLLSVPTGILNNVIYLKITNPNADSIPTKVVYTLDGSEPTLNSTEYIGDSIFIFQASVVRAKAFPLTMNNYLASHDTYGTYLFNIDHSTPILLVTTQNSNCKYYIICLYSAKLSNCGKLFKALTTTYYWRQ